MDMVYYDYRSGKLTILKGVIKMKDNAMQITKEFIENRDTIKKTMKLESSYIYPVAANVFCAVGVKADADKLRECRNIIKKNAGFASYLKGTILPVVAAKLCVADDPEAQFEKVMDMYGILKEYFRRSEYLFSKVPFVTSCSDISSSSSRSRIFAKSGCSRGSPRIWR